MSDFDTLRVKVGRRPIVVVEIDLDFCQNTYGTSPCTAALGTTGTAKCYNTFKSCQDTENFNRGVKTYKFCSNDGRLPIGQNLFPCITSIDITPSVLVQEDFSIAASVTVTAQDFTIHDRGIDPYVKDRASSCQGTFFGRLRARNPYLANRVMRVKTGYIDDNRAIYTMTRTYLIDHIEGPDADGSVRLVGKDPLRYTDDDKYQVPVPSRGVLSTELDIGITTLGLAAPGIGDDYPSSGVVRIDDELIAYALKAGDLLQGLTRGYLGTTEDTHDANAKVQICVSYANETVPNIIYDLLVNYAQIDPSFITLSDWTDEADNWLGSFTSTVTLSDPASVKDIIKEVLQASGSSLWWDEEEAQIRFKVIMPFLIKQDVVILNDTANIIEGSVQIEDLEDERLSRVTTYIDLKSPVLDVDAKNFQTIIFSIETDAEGENEYQTPQALEIKSRWTPSIAYADSIANRLLYRRRNTPRQVTLQLDAKDATIKIGDLRDVKTRLMQDFDGSDAIIRCVVTQVREVMPGTLYEYVLVQVAPRGGMRAALIAPDSTNVWTSATADEKKNYMFLSDDNGFLSDGSEAPVLC
ncbi:hypothetical protein QWJ07_04020 [Frankia sp. RB7]|nr:hypothetical protein [Frankia sp. RB7]